MDFATQIGLPQITQINTDFFATNCTNEHK
jgi:hypothetical protein